jgi:hypothetical protein
LHCWRWIERLQEESDWEPQTSTGPGMLYLFGELHGIKGLPQSRRIEFMPYTVARLKTYRSEDGNPFADKGRTWLGSLGLDAKIGLSSNFTADLTINPDFGQVEADPSVMNLTAFETFYSENRPFFIEGKNIFNFDCDGADIFYSRRIGHAPVYSPTLNSGEFIDYPDKTTILSATKISGKTAKGLAVGVLHSITTRETAEIDSSGRRRAVSVEPATNYIITRIQKDFNEGNTVLGGIFTSVNRFIDDSHLEFLNRNAFTGGVDVLHHWADKEFFVEAKFIGSTINGTTEAIRNLQQSSARYYQRPDANYLSYDSTSTELSGFGGSIEVGKGSKGLWRYSAELLWRSPGLEVNDIGYMQTADIIEEENQLSYFINQPVSIFRSYSVSLKQFNKWNFGREHLSSGVGLNFGCEFLNNWGISNYISYTSESLDMHVLRGGYAMQLPSVWYTNFFIRTDPSKPLYAYIITNGSFYGDESGTQYSVAPGLSIMLTNTLKVSLNCNYSTNTNCLQYVATKSAQSGTKYILGSIEQRTLGGTFRIDYNITPTLSVQYYGSPFASVGTYSQFKTADDPRAGEYSKRFMPAVPILNGNLYAVQGIVPSQIDYSFENPDFAFSQFRSNFVFRWEYRPGSQLYIVWSQERTNYSSPNIQKLSSSFSNIPKIYPNNIFLVKLNYWFSM